MFNNGTVSAWMRQQLLNGMHARLFKKFTGLTIMDDTVALTNSLAEVFW